MPLVRLGTLDTSTRPSSLTSEVCEQPADTDGPLDFNLVGVLDLGMCIFGKAGCCRWSGGAVEFLFGVTVPHSNGMSIFFSFRVLILVMAGVGHGE